ncbi:MAG TPA: asparagine synthase (glutamine-hydrolyzing) [Bryobacteraceae bacterium]|jgi:asparagine synthase (glutamine-hydrolysing)|nr:asparagine synthase (glutamine-hydrolyzing) [Bryobacteraceae bacterium]
MCGIAGFVTVEPSPPQKSILERMTDAIHHRGPDASGFYQDEYASLGHRRLSIIDIAGGQQPMTNEDRTIWISYNGEIFNHADLRPELEKARHRYATHCDTEAVLHAYEEYGPACLQHFRGMFAFAIWDTRARQLFCGRDRLGKKPFYYFWDGRLFAFASEIKALLRHPAISPKLEETMLPEYLAFGYLSEERTLFSSIRKLMPGHHLTLDLAASRPEPQIHEYWDIPSPERREERDDASWIRECRERLEETVRMRLMSDVPLGMFLSGGVDSSAIAAVMKRQVTGPVKTFAVGYQEAPFSELSYAAHVARNIGTDHHEVTVSMEDFFNAVPRLIWHEDEPITWPSSVSLYFVSRLAAEQVKVVLTGEGSDEMFGGYARYHFYALNQRWLPLYRMVPGPLRRAIRSRVGSTSLLKADFRRKLQHTLMGRGEDLESLYLDNFYSAFSAAEQSVLFPSLTRESGYRNFRRYWDRRTGLSPLDRMLYADQKTYLVELLMKQDRMSMAASIESRVPFLDHEFVEFSTRVPDRLKIRDGEGKYILKKAVEDLLPHEIIYRKKMGFPTPLRQWLLDPRAGALYGMLLSRDGLLSSYVDAAALDRLIGKHVRGEEDATDRIWRLLTLQVWGDLFLNGKLDQRWDGLMAHAPSAV